MLLPIMVLACAGLCITAYTYAVERRISNDPAYKPVCDISDRISCSKPMQSPYANLFFVSNALVGMGFYTVVLLLALFDARLLLAILTAGSCVASLGLAYLLYFKVKAFCLLCTALYVINATLFYLSLLVD